MSGRRWFLAAVGLVSLVLPVAPAVAASCTTHCYRYQADITDTGWTGPAQVIPGGTHVVTLRVTNTSGQFAIGGGSRQIALSVRRRDVNLSPC